MARLRTYLDRIGLGDKAAETQHADLALLQSLIYAHTQTIPFENLNSLLRVPVPLDLESLEAKLIFLRRGGYCFEQNAYFAAILDELGFSVTRLAARVLWGSSAAHSNNIPRSHMVLMVDLADQRYLCDVGFGGLTPTAALTLTTGAEQATPHETYRLVDYNGLYLLQASLVGSWQDVYVFDLQPQSPIDYEVANFYVATHPASHFRHTLMAARAFEGGRYHLRNYLLTEFAASGDKRERRLDSAEDLLATLDKHFGIEVPDAAGFAKALERIEE